MTGQITGGTQNRKKKKKKEVKGKHIDIMLGCQDLFLRPVWGSKQTNKQTDQSKQKRLPSLSFTSISGHGVHVREGERGNDSVLDIGDRCVKLEQKRSDLGSDAMTHTNK